MTARISTVEARYIASAPQSDYGNRTAGLAADLVEAREELAAEKARVATATARYAALVAVVKDHVEADDYLALGPATVPRITSLRAAKRAARESINSFLSGVTADMTKAVSTSAVRRSAVVLCERRGSFAAILSRKHSRAVELPGGKIEPGESAYAGAVREATEELGVPVRVIPGAIGDFEHVYRGEHWCCTAYRGDFDGEPTGSPEGEAVWATRAEVLTGTYSDLVREVLVAYDATTAAAAGST